MGFISAIWLIVLGILGAASIIVAKRPDAKEAIAKLAPYQGWIGAVSALWGVWGLISSVLNLGWLSVAPVYWVMFLSSSVVQALLGFLLGIGVLKTFAKDEAAHQKMDQLLAKLSPYQGKLGLAAIGVGIAMLVVTVLFGV